MLMLELMVGPNVCGADLWMCFDLEAWSSGKPGSDTTCHGAITLTQKAGLMGCVAPLLRSPVSYHFFDVGLFSSVALSPTQSYDALITD